MPTEVTAGVYDITCERLESGKRYRVFLDTNGIPTLFDTGFSDTADMIIDGIDEIGIEPEHLVITHGDVDHIGGFDVIVDYYDVETWVPEQLKDPGTDSMPDHHYGDGDTIGGYTAVHVPGHEPEQHVLIDETAGIAVMGDALYGADQRGLPAGEFHLPPARFSRDLNQAEESLERLLGFDFEVALVFHGSSILENASEKLERYVNIPE